MLKEGTTFHGIYCTKDSHFGKGQTGLGLHENGTFKMALNKPKPFETKGYIGSNGAPYYPTHRSLGGHSAIYSFGYADDKTHGTIWLYPSAELHIPQIKKALLGLIGHYGITGKTVVRSNSSRKKLFTLGELKSGFKPKLANGTLKTKKKGKRKKRKSSDPFNPLAPKPLLNAFLGGVK